MRNGDWLAVHVALIQVLAIQHPLVGDLVLDAKLVQPLVEGLCAHAIVLSHGSDDAGALVLNHHIEVSDLGLHLGDGGTQGYNLLVALLK